MAQYPNDPDGRLKHERLGISFDDSLKGVYLNVNFETKNDEINQQSIISMGHGRKTVFK